MKRYMLLMLAPILSGCGSITLPAAVRMQDGTTLLGTTTAATSGGTFSVSATDRSMTCNGTYDPFDLSPTISVPVLCSDGRYANAIVTRAPDGRSGRGSAILSDGTSAQVAFGNNALTTVSQANPDIFPSATSASTLRRASITSPSHTSPMHREQSYRRYYTGPRGGCYYINSNGNKTYVEHSYCR